MLKKIFCFLFFFCIFREEKETEHNYDNVMFKSYTPTQADEPRCSIYKNRDFPRAA